LFTKCIDLEEKKVLFELIKKFRARRAVSSSKEKEYKKVLSQKGMNRK